MRWRILLCSRKIPCLPIPYPASRGILALQKSQLTEGGT